MVVFLLKELIESSIFPHWSERGQYFSPLRGLLWEIQLLSRSCRANSYLGIELYLASWKASGEWMNQVCWLNKLEAAETWEWSRWEEWQKIPWLLWLAGPPGVDKHIKVGVGKLSAFSILTFDRKGINRTTYLLCLNIISEEKFNQILFSNVS